MYKINIKKTLYHLKHRYGTLNNVVVLVAVVVASSWAWGSVTTMQRNYALQRDVEARERQLELTRLEVETLEYQKNYFQTDEYRELAAREKFGLALPGEKVLLLPPNTSISQDPTVAVAKPTESESDPGATNVQQWLSFLLGHTTRRVNAETK